ncbi:AAA family ATPase [Rothia sp. ARF10]|nr:AAA family ATPase [Rothia sp. ARF10]
MQRWSPPDLPARWRVHASPLLGRRAELRVLDDAWSAVEGGTLQVVFVEGDAGMGKTRFVAEAGRALHGHGAAVLLGACVADLGAPYQPFVGPLALLRTALMDGAGPEGLGPQLSSVVERLDRLARPTRSEVSVPANRRDLYEAVCEALRVVSAVRPVVLVLEDLHWAGETSLDLLAHVVRDGGDIRMLCLATLRGGPPDASAGLASTIAELHRIEGVSRVRLTPLALEDVAEYVRTQCGVDAARAASVAPLLLERTGGNPFYLREVVRDLGDRGGLDSLDDGVMATPRTVLDLYAARLDRLDATTRVLLDAAAVIGDEFSTDLLAHVTDTDVETVLAAMDGAEQAGLVRALDRAGASFAFDHVLGRQSIVDLMPRRELLHRHAAVALALERGPSSAPNRVQRMAHHFASAEVLGHREAAVRYLTQAAGLARAGLAHHEAGQALVRAAGLADDVGLRDALRLDAAVAFRDAGAFGTACDLAREVAREAGPVDRLRAAVAFEGAAWRVGDPGFESADLLTSALAGTDLAADDPLRIRAVASLGRAITFTGDFDRGRQVCAHAIALAESTGDRATLAHSLECSITNVVRPGTAAQTATWSARLAEVGRAGEDAEAVFQGASILALVGYLTGDVERYESASSETLWAAARTGAPFALMQSACFEWTRAFARGDLDRARSISEDLMHARGVGTWAELSDRLSVQTFVLRREQGRLDGVAALVTGDEDPGGHWAPGLLALHAALGRRPAARRVLGWMMEQDLARYRASATWPATLAFLVEAAVWLADRDAASALRGPAAEYEGHNLAVGPLIAVFGSADRYLGMLDSTLGRPAAEDLLRSAMEMDRRMGAPLFEAHGAVALLQHLQRSGARTGDVEAARRDAVDRVGRLRSARVTSMLESVVPPRRRSDGLTRREVEILRLIAQGLSNRELAERLVISENTVTNHVRSILLKTGASNRTMASRYAAEHGVLDPDT